MGHNESESFEQAQKRFDDIDEAARRRAAARVAAGVQPYAALADAAVEMHITRVYNR